MEKVKCWVIKRKTKKTRRHKKKDGTVKILPVYSYAVQWKDPKTGQRKTETIGGDEVAARVTAEKRRQELREGTHQGTTTITWDRFVDEHLQVVKATKSVRHYEGVSATLRFFTAICKPAKPSSVNYQMLEKYVTSRLSQGRANTTVNGDLAELQGVFSAAVDRGYTLINPVQQHRKKLRLREAEPTPVIVEPDEFGAILNECPNDVWRGIVTVGYFAGLRKGEIINLKWDDIDLDDNMLRIVNQNDHTTKSGRIRRIPINAELAKAIRKLQANRFKCEYVFISTTGGKLRYNVSNQMTKIVIRAGLVDKDGKQRITLHNLRDTFITNLLESGADPRTVQELAGHADMRTTMKYYAGVRAKSMKAATDRLCQFAATGTA